MATPTTAPRHNATGTPLTDDRRFLLAVVRTWAGDVEGNDADERYVSRAADDLAAEYDTTTEVVLGDWMAGALWGLDHRTTCVGCGDADYAPTCPSCQMDAGIPVGQR